MKKLILFILATIVLISCNKKVTLKGRVLNPVTNQGIEGFTIAVSADTWELPGGAKPVGETTSNANGDFVLEFKKSGYDFSVYKEGYYNIGWYQNGEILPGQLPVNDKGKTMHADFYAVPYGEIKTSVHNINCSGSTDTLIFKRIYQLDPNNSVFQPFTFTGCYDNYGAFAKVPSGDYKLEWTVIRSGVSNTYSHILSVPGNGQAIYNIDY
ncbi:hypothetical protein CW751_12435 [Brumimicrobium salinarum]|uniref:Carboxypeptidase regulatory-like domain-containing protein n=1 Tax=Brumimicrobium salinarum TaxID=2058658 RepID=A0A2I0QZW6_9FLAO|nr:carboxypeptidase-like regulatory domain-containing protein [Brumimicrobium salinarum]PKR79886.1 hypothetical protein CW751_12435 [Brumimicrobium salinarum]